MAGDTTVNDNSVEPAEQADAREYIKDGRFPGPCSAVRDGRTSTFRYERGMLSSASLDDGKEMMTVVRKNGRTHSLRFEPKTGLRHVITYAWDELGNPTRISIDLNEDDKPDTVVQFKWSHVGTPKIFEEPAFPYFDDFSHENNRYLKGDFVIGLRSANPSRTLIYKRYYNEAGQITRMTFDIDEDGEEDFSGEMAYDNEGRIVSTRYLEFGKNRTVFRETYHYDGAGNLVLVENIRRDKSFMGNHRIQFTYDSKGNCLSEEKQSLEGKVLRRYDYSYECWK